MARIAITLHMPCYSMYSKVKVKVMLILFKDLNSTRASWPLNLRLPEGFTRGPMPGSKQQLKSNKGRM